MRSAEESEQEPMRPPKTAGATSMMSNLSCPAPPPLTPVQDLDVDAKTSPKSPIQSTSETCSNVYSHYVYYMGYIIQCHAYRH